LKDRLGIGIIGAGFVTNAFHVNAWRGIRHADIVGICDHHENNAKATAALCRSLRVGNPKIYTDPHELVSDPNVKAVWITVPNFVRLPVMEAITEEALQGNTELVGVACEKPLARTVKEARKMRELVKKAGLLHGYLENQVFAPSVVRGKEILWKRGAAIAGRPYLARCAEEHSGPHKPWFWEGAKQGGGVLNDMMCHSHEASRFLLTAPEENKEELKPLAISAEIASLKWTRSDYIKRLKDMTGGKVNYAEAPVEDYARANVVYETPDGVLTVVEATTSWSFVGTGLRLSFELLGPEYSMQINSLNPELNVFFSRQVKGKVGEDLVEKQNAEQGLMPVVADEAITYGYQSEDRHIVESFLDGKLPRETWNDGVFIVELMMACYMAAEKKKKLKFPPDGLEDFVPKVGQGTWNPRSITEVQPH
jgi:predicted dehydrogenase